MEPLNVGDLCITLRDAYFQGTNKKLPAGTQVIITKVGDVFGPAEKWIELLYRRYFGDVIIYQGRVSDGEDIRGPREFFLKINPDNSIKLERVREAIRQ